MQTNKQTTEQPNEPNPLKYLESVMNTLDIKIINYLLLFLSLSLSLFLVSMTLIITMMMMMMMLLFSLPSLSLPLTQVRSHSNNESNTEKKKNEKILIDQLRSFFFFKLSITRYHFLLIFIHYVYDIID